jgi:pimeloyl-ACP methyl ester carboxylesterase
MAVFVVAHGAWSSAFAWRKMRPLMREMGHELVTPSYTGLGERFHLAHGKIDLDAHIRDVQAVLHYEDLREVILVGHSYGGMVATGVADREADRIAQIIYLDAFVPKDGQSLFDLTTPYARAHMEKGAAATGDGWGIPPISTPPDTAPEDVEWLTPRRHPQPILTFAQGIRLTNGETNLPRTFIYCTRTAPGDVFAQFAARAKTEPGWNYRELDASHNPHVTAPEALAGIFDNIAGDKG